MPQRFLVKRVQVLQGVTDSSMDLYCWLGKNVSEGTQFIQNNNRK